MRRRGGMELMGRVWSWFERGKTKVGELPREKKNSFICEVSRAARIYLDSILGEKK